MRLDVWVAADVLLTDDAGLDRPRGHVALTGLVVASLELGDCAAATGLAVVGSAAAIFPTQLSFGGRVGCRWRRSEGICLCAGFSRAGSNRCRPLASGAFAGRSGGSV